MTPCGEDRGRWVRAEEARGNTTPTTPATPTTDDPGKDRWWGLLKVLGIAALGIGLTASVNFSHTASTLSAGNSATLKERGDQYTKDASRVEERLKAIDSSCTGHQAALDRIDRNVAELLRGLAELTKAVERIEKQVTLVLRDKH